MKKILPKLKLKQTLFLGTLILLMVSFSSYGQVIFDGSYTPGEYNDGDSIVIDSNANGTCDIHTIYAAIQDEPDTVNGGNNYYLVLGIRNGNNGSAIFRYYFNTIPGEGCVGETHSGTFYPIDSADVVIQIDVSKDNKFAVYNWDESTQSWIEDGDDFATSIGDYAVSDGEFSEIRAPLTGASNITDLCDLGNDGNISLAQYIAFSGGNINSSVCSARNIEFDYNVNGNITGEATYCSGTNTSTILTLTGVNGSVLYWESSTDLNNWTSIGNAGNLIYTTSSTLTQTTYYRAVIISDICPGIQKTTGAAAITIEECCTETVIAGDDFEVCENGMISLDATFSDNLNFASATWVGPNGFTSSSIDTAFIASSTDYSGEYIVTVDYGTDCISFDTVAVIVLPAYTGTDSDVICDSELPYTYGDSTFTAAGTKDVVFSTINGCDSIITFTLEVNPTYTGTDSDVICDSELPYTYGDSTFTAAGTKDVVFSTINGCDSIITFTLEVNPTYTGTDSDVICDSELPYTYGDSTFTAAGTKDVVFSTINGCDSIITFTLEVNPTYTGTDSDVICDSELPYTYGDSTFTAAGTKDVVFSTINGCDSIITFTLEVNPTYTGTDSDVICDSELPYTYGDSTFTAAGTKDVVFSTINGCDSIITFTLEVNPTFTGSDSDVICDSELPYTYGDSTFTAAGTKDVVFSTINGCDSIITFTLEVNPTYTGTDSDVICDSELPYTYGDSTFTAAGTKDVVFSTINGCDSIITFTLEVNPTYTGTDSDVICDSELPYTYGDSTWTAAGSKDVVFSTINGCDSIVTVNLIINDTYTADETTPVKRELCEADFLADGFAWGDSTWTAAGSKDVVFSTINGCDSIVTVNLIINDTYTADETTPVKKELCEADFEADGFSWGDSTWTTAGSKDVVFSTINGCDSIVTVNLIINDTYTADETTPVKRELCEADFEADGFAWGDSTWTAAGSKDVVFSTINGCDSIVTVNLIINDTYTADETTPVKRELCEADFEADGFAWGDSTWTAAGSKDVVFSTINGCDSIVTVNLIINDTYTADETTPVKRELCEADFEADGFSWGDSTWTTAGSKDVVFSTINGCDSIVTVNLIINDTYTADETTPVKKELCEADFEADGFAWGDSTWTAAGSKDVVFSTINGCDSIVTVNLIINDTYTADETTPVKKELCEADFEADGFAWGDSTWTAAGSKDVVFSTINGCDSIVTVNLIINDTYTADETTPVKRELCEADFEADGFSWGDSTWTTAGSKDVVFSTINGCDSIVTVNLIINDTYTADETTPVKKELCEADFEADGFAWGDSTWTAAGSKDVVFSTINGCDSIVTVNLIINDTYTADETTPVKRELCEADFEADGFSWGDSTWTTAGSKDVVFSTINGCDSIVTVNLIINDTYTADETTPVKRELCEADFEADGFAWGDSTWTAAGSKDVVFSTINGCDSIVTVNLIINDTYTADETTPVKRELCEADFEADGFSWGDSTWTTAGSKDVVFSTINGCDSIVTVTLTVIESTFETISRTVCDQVTINDSTYNESGTYIQNLTNANGCDSTLTINLIVLDSPEDTIDVTTCDEYQLNDSVYTQSGTYTQVVESEEGCTGTITVNLTILESTQEMINQVVCDSYTLNGRTYTESGTYRQYTTNDAGCDSTIILNLTVREDIIELTNEASDLTVACDGNGNTDAFENWLATNGTTGSAQAGFGSVNWSNNFEALTPGCCNTGSATVTFTATDDCGNSVSTTATFTIIDTTAPAFTAPEDITIYSDAECNYDISVEATGDVTDETDACCDDLNAEYTDLVEQGACAGEWIITRTWTLADQCGNQAEPQVQLITVMDTIAPTAICSDITIQLDESGLATINAEDINGGSTDNCGIDTIFISQYNFTCDELGTNQVTLTVVDNCGNTSTCTATVTVESGEANCGSIQTTPDVLDIVVCNGREVSGTMNILDNDNLAGAGFTITANNLPQGVQLDLTTGELTYYSQQITETTIQFTYTVCHDVYTNDCSEALVTINVLIDTDCDGIHDAIDIDDDDDGILDVDEEAYSLNQQTLDSDGDGIVDRLDIDSDNDGIPDNIEWQQNIEEGIQYGSYAYGTDMGYDYFPPLGTDENGDGWDDRYDRDGVYYEPVDMDGDGTPDYLDTDSDGDGIEDWIEGWDAMPHDTIADTDIVYTDSDGDGLDDAYDSYDTSQEWLHGLNAIGSYAPLQDMAADTANNIRDWRDIIEPPEDIDDQQAEGCELNIPDGFSPNQDGYNDFFEMRFTCDTGEQLFEDVYPEAKIEIFNRWGNLVYEQENYGNVSRWGSTDAWWDGTSMHDMQIGNDKLPAATYFYILYLNNGQEAITGTIFLNN
ncbi:gliding motility-associated C-terminal domain-containing protein [uncultured Draconibacterium sp.]|uniref:gliding motility-associated C-terminal domain-containing protein n=1 Tax=uncultured Draconibacterium sp. TaxID=1573823 RepID=UPI002AA80016|nr:gliding motility-associated C-terminal domain-containing protein [uncultured Draconibacterium sp.]